MGYGSTGIPKGHTSKPKRKSKSYVGSYVKRGKKGKKK